MKRYLLGASLVAALAASAKDADFFQMTLETQGGLRKFERLETLNYEFSEKDGVQSRRGRHIFKFHDAQGLRGRLETVGDGRQALTVFTSTGLWRWENGAPVTDFESLTKAKREADESAFWAFFPFNLKEAGAQIVPVGLDYFEDKLTRRLAVAAPSLPFMAQTSRFFIFIDMSTGRAEGASFVDGAGAARRVVLKNYSNTPVSVATLRVDEVTSVGKRQFAIVKADFNSYVDEKFLDPTQK